MGFCGLPPGNDQKRVGKWKKAATTAMIETPLTAFGVKSSHGLPEACKKAARGRPLHPGSGRI